MAARLLHDANPEQHLNNNCCAAHDRNPLMAPKSKIMPSQRDAAARDQRLFGILAEQPPVTGD
jgi:hypothetical protein